MFTLLDTFTSVYETRNFTKTSKKLSVSQPAVTIRIKNLEKILGVKLFDRNKEKEIEATPEARLLYGKIFKLRNEWEALEYELKNNKTKRKKLKIGVSFNSEQIISDELLKILESFRNNFEIKIFLYNSEKIMHKIEKHELQFGIIAMPVTSEDIKTFFIKKEQLVLAGKNKNIFFTREKGSGTYYFSKKFLKNHSELEDKTILVNNNKAIISLISSGKGFSIIPKNLLPHNTPYSLLGLDYYQEIFGIYYAEEQDDEINTCIQFIQNNIENLKLIKTLS